MRTQPSVREEGRSGRQRKEGQTAGEVAHCAASNGSLVEDAGGALQRHLSDILYMALWSSGGNISGLEEVLEAAKEEERRKAAHIKSIDIKMLLQINQLEEMLSGLHHH